MSEESIFETEIQGEVPEITSVAKSWRDMYKGHGSVARRSNYIFQDIAKNAKNLNIQSQDVEAAREWFRQTALDTTVNRDKLINTSGPFEKSDRISQNAIGKMYNFLYNPKWKDILPYYDRFPLIFPIEFHKDGPLGINLHYLPPNTRAQLMNALYETLNNDKMNKTTKLQISYQILKGSSKYKAFKPCIKKYLFSHVKSPFINVKPENWDAALMLPMSDFRKSSEENVWKDSMNIIANRK